MRDLMAELKELRLHGMATAWAELTAQGESNTASSKWGLYAGIPEISVSPAPVPPRAHPGR